MQVADLHALKATIDASMPDDCEALEAAAARVRAGSLSAEAGQLPPAHEVPARRVRAAVWQPGCLAAARPIAAGNVGMRLLAKMGWKEGSGAPRPLYFLQCLLPSRWMARPQASDELTASCTGLTGIRDVCSCRHHSAAALTGLGRERQGMTSPMAALGNLRKSGLGLEVPCDDGAPAAKKSRKQPTRKQPQQQAARHGSAMTQLVTVPQQAPRVLHPGPASLAALPLPFFPLSSLQHHQVQHHAGTMSTSSSFSDNNTQQLCQLALQENAALKQQMQALKAQLRQQRQAVNVSKNKRQKVGVHPEPPRPVSTAAQTLQMLVVQHELQQQQQAAQAERQGDDAAPPALVAADDAVAVVQPQSYTAAQPRESKKARRARKLADRAARKALRKAENEVCDGPAGRVSLSGSSCQVVTPCTSVIRHRHVLSEQWRIGQQRTCPVMRLQAKAAAAAAAAAASRQARIDLHEQRAEQECQQRRQRMVDQELQRLRQAIADKEQAQSSAAAVAQHGTAPPVMA